MSDLTLIVRNLFRNRLRTGLLMVSILIAFAIFGLLVSFEQAFKAGDQASPDRLVVVNKINFTQPLPIAYANRVRGVDGVRRVTHANWFGGYFQEPRNFLIALAVEPESYLEVFGTDFVVTPEARQTFLRERTSVLIGATLAGKWGWQPGDRLPISSNIFSQKSGSHTWDMTVAGLITGRTPRIDTNFLIFPYAYFDESRSFGKDSIGWLILSTDGPAVNERVAASVDRMFANSTAETETSSEKAFNQAFAAQFGNIALIVLLVVGAAFVTILLIVGNTMAMAVRSRAREIAVLKTLGFPPGRILGQVLAESVLLALLGGLPGLALAALAAHGLRDSLANFAPGLALTPGIALTGVGLMVGFGLITGAIPAFTAMRTDIVTALGRS